MRYWIEKNEIVFVAVKPTVLNIDGITVPIKENDVFMECAGSYEWVNMMDEGNEDYADALFLGEVELEDLLQNTYIQPQISKSKHYVLAYDLFGGSFQYDFN